jgi:hypothetical protein
MGGNGLTIANNGADLELTDGTDTYGFKFAAGSRLLENRGDAYAGQISSGTQTYADAEPFKRKVYDNFLGGMGQTNDNKVYGGTGIGGDDTKYFYGDCKTDRGGYLLPSMARNLVYNTIAGQKTPISDGIDPVAGDEFEVPRGVMPLPLSGRGQTATLNQGSFVTTGATVTRVRVLVYIRQQISGGTFLVSIDLKDGVTTHHYEAILDLSTTTFTGWKWATLPLAGGTGALVAGHTITYFVYGEPSNDGKVAVGCYANDTPDTNSLHPYFQLMTSVTPFKYWANPLQKVEHIDNGAGVYANIALHSTGMFNLGDTTTAGTAGTSPEKLYSSGTYMSSLWFNSKLYVSVTTGMIGFNYAAATTNGAAPTNVLDPNALLRNMVEWGGKIYGTGALDRAIYKWDGVFPIVLGTNLIKIVNGDTIGQAGTPINRLLVFQGNLWVIKPEGLFQLYADPVIITTDPGNTPRIVPVVTDLPSPHAATGKWHCAHQGMIYFNYRDRLYQVTPGAAGPPQVTVLSLPMPWYRLSYYHYVNGLSSDGVNLYASWNNLGVFQFVNQTWHPITEFYEQVAVESQSSGLRWVPNPTAAPDSLFVGDGRTIVQLSVPGAAAPYTSQIYRNHQNKCGYLITSATDFEQAEITKYIHSLVMRVVAGGHRYKVVGVLWQTTGTDGNPGLAPSFKTILEDTFIEGLNRQDWNRIFNVDNGESDPHIITKKISAPGVYTANTLSPGYWLDSDFNNQGYQAEKLAVMTTDTTTTPPATNILTAPVKAVMTQFIIYFWNPTPGQHATTGLALMAVDSLIVKYQSIQNYIPLYQCTIDFQAMVSGTGAMALTTTQIEDSYDWLRSQTGRHSPLQATFRVRRTGTTAQKTKTILFFPQNPGWISDPTTTVTNAGDPLIKTVGLQMMSVQSEYPNV